MGGGLVGPALARALSRRGHPALAMLERGPAGVLRADPMWLPFQAYDVMEDVGVMDVVRREGARASAGPTSPPPTIAILTRPSPRG